MLDAAQGLKVGVSTDAEAHYGPVVSAAHKAKVESYIQMGVDEGADLKLDAAVTLCKVMRMGTSSGQACSTM